MTKHKGEIVTVLTIGAFVVLTVASIISSAFISKNKQTTKTQAVESWWKCPGGNCNQCGVGWWDQGCFYEKGGALVQPPNDTMCRCSDVNSCVIYDGRSYVQTGNNWSGVWCGNDCRIHPDAKDHICAPVVAANTPVPKPTLPTPSSNQYLPPNPVAPTLPPGQPSPTSTTTWSAEATSICNQERSERFFLKGGKCVGCLSAVLTSLMVMMLTSHSVS